MSYGTAEPAKKGHPNARRGFRSGALPFDRFKANGSSHHFALDKNHRISGRMVLLVKLSRHPTQLRAPAAA